MSKVIEINKGDTIGKDELWCYWFYCTNSKCKASIAEGSKYCSSCGKKINWVGELAYD